MPTYTIELTEEQLKALSGILTMAEFWKNKQSFVGFDAVETGVFWKVSDLMERYYDSKGIVD